jgi:16S rRNA C1402 N4-methylase RsmH
MRASTAVDAIVLDIGVSSMQFDEEPARLFLSSAKRRSICA